MEDPDVEPFTAPVPPETDAYGALIGYPMDLGTIWTSFEAGGYPTPAALLEDVGKVWFNCGTYNDGACPAPQRRFVCLLFFGGVGGWGGAQG